MPSAPGAPGASRYQMVGKYRILAHIATGGMGAVYKAFDPQAERVVALKLLAPEPIAAHPQLLERFRREAQHGGRLRHENIVTLHEFGEAAGAYYLVMEFVEGVDLYQRLREGRLDAAEARTILVQMAHALEHAHEHGIVHRDIKPPNILLTEKDGRLIAKLSDFGLARNTNEEEFRVTRDGATVGTVDYIAPEQAQSGDAADVRSDIYSLGCTMYHALAGVPPFDGSLAERIYKRLHAEPPSVRKHNPAVPPELAAVLQRMLAPKPANRYQTPAELLEALTGNSRRAAPSSESEIATSPSLPAMSGPQRIAAGRFEYAGQLLGAGDVQEGMRVLQECCRLDPFNLVYRRRLRHVQRALRETWLGAWLARLAALPAKRRLRSASKKGDHLKVLEFGEQVMMHLPWDAEAQVAMAKAAETLGQTELAVWLLKHGRRKGASNVAVKRALALLYEHQQQFSAAIAVWESLRRSDPNNLEAQQRIRNLSARETIVRGHYEEVDDEED